MLAALTAAPSLGYVLHAPTARAPARAHAVLQEAPPVPAEEAEDIFKSPEQKFGSTTPAHAWPKPWTNTGEQEHVQIVKAHSGQLMEPLLTDMSDDEIFVSGDSIHILKHHGSYMQQDRSLKGVAKKQSYQFMLRLKMPCGEVPGPLYAELDDISNKWGHGDLRATTRQAFQLHGVLKGNLKSVISSIANIGSNTYGGCGDISRNVMVPPVMFPNSPSYMYCQQYARAMAELFKPMTNAFYEIWLDGKKADNVEYWQRDIGEKDLGVDLEKVRVEDRGNGIITGHAVEPLYGKTYLPKKFKIAFTVPGDNGVDLYINDIGCVVIMEDDGVTLAGFNIVVGGGMGRTHKAEHTFARAASHLGFVRKDDFFEVMKAVLAVQRDHGNREVRANARLKYLVHTLGIDDFRTLTEKYFGQPIEPWRPLPEWKFLDWMCAVCTLPAPCLRRLRRLRRCRCRPARAVLTRPSHVPPRRGWTEQGDGKWMLGINVESGRVRDTPELRLKTGLRKVVDAFHGVDLVLTPSQSIVLKNIEEGDRTQLRSGLQHSLMHPPSPPAEASSSQPHAQAHAPPRTFSRRIRQARTSSRCCASTVWRRTSRRSTRSRASRSRARRTRSAASPSPRPSASSPRSTRGCGRSRCGPHHHAPRCGLLRDLQQCP